MTLNSTVSRLRQGTLGFVWGVLPAVCTLHGILRWHEQQLYAQLNRNITVTDAGRRIRVALTIVPDEDGATGSLDAADDFGEKLGRVPVSPAFKLNANNALAWAESGFVLPDGRATGILEAKGYQP